MATQDTQTPSTDDLTLPPVHGRAGRGLASILPHLERLQQARIAAPFHESDFEATPSDWPMPGEFGSKPRA